jgi:hypothetical protein
MLSLRQQHIPANLLSNLNILQNFHHNVSLGKTINWNCCLEYPYKRLFSQSYALFRDLETSRIVSRQTSIFLSFKKKTFGIRCDRHNFIDQIMSGRRALWNRAEVMIHASNFRTTTEFERDLEFEVRSCYETHQTGMISSDTMRAQVRE